MKSSNARLSIAKRQTASLSTLRTNLYRKLSSWLAKSGRWLSALWRTVSGKRRVSPTSSEIWFLVPSHGILTLRRLNNGRIPSASDISRHQKMLKRLARSIRRSRSGGPRDDGQQLRPGIIITRNIPRTIGLSTS